MSILTTLLGTTAFAAPIGRATCYKPEDYRDVKPARPSKPQHERPLAYTHMVNEKVDNIGLIFKALAAGANTQAAIVKATGLCKATISVRLRQLEAGAEVIVDKNTVPWTYQLIDIESDK